MGRPPKAEKSEVIYLRAPKTLVARLRDESKKQGREMSNMLERILREYFKIPA